MRSLLFVILLYSCTEKKDVHPALLSQMCDSTGFTFKKDILPVMNANCNYGACHSANGEPNLDFTIYENVAQEARTGDLAFRLNLPPEDPQHMPEGFQLSPCDNYKIKTWILQNYPEN